MKSVIPIFVLVIIYALIVGKPVLVVGKHVLVVGKHVLAVGKHVLLMGKHVLLVGKHVLERMCVQQIIQLLLEYKIFMNG